MKNIKYLFNNTIYNYSSINKINIPRYLNNLLIIQIMALIILYIFHQLLLN